MTPIGHFQCEAALAGNIDLTTERETSLCFAYYLVFLAVFFVLKLLIPAGTWAMHLHDWFGNAALIFFIILWSRKDDRRKYFVCLLIGGQVLSAYTHMFDSIVLSLHGSIPEGMWRPHNILHTPLAALVVPLIALPLIRLLMGKISLRAAYLFLCVGYLLHIVSDTITYGYPVYALWPILPAKFALVDFFRSPDAIGAYMGNPL